MGVFDGDDCRGGERGQGLEQLSDGLSGAGIAEVRCDFDEGNENKGTLGKARMWNLQS